MPEANVNAAASIFENLRQKVNAMELILNDQTRLSVTISIGVVSRTDIADLESAVRIADGVLYLAKKDGRNRVRFA